WKNIIVERFGAFAQATTDDELTMFAQDGVTTFWHACCTGKIGFVGDSDDVVDSDSRLISGRGLCTVDASVFPMIPAAHLQGPVYAIAERAARLIKDTWSKNH
ncbi:GMC oxidoreductase-domain-containing protein, partial [Amylostereum chailletii]